MIEMLPKRECYLFRDPETIYDLIGWDRETKKYHLRNDRGESVDVFHSEFVPVSLAGEDLVLASETGEIVAASEAMERKLTIARTAVPVGLPSHESRGERPKARTSPKSREEATETRSRVRSMLEPCKTREEIAGVAAGVLGGSAETLIAKYAHLDNGRFRMVLGNRMVGTLK